ncbi:MAG: sulfite exporter TauE/SafE family protein [Nitrososphaerota archaeon]|nr:sulfite exporter TauE/SafE family protein [Nitrososphaerota archaeon]
MSLLIPELSNTYLNSLAIGIVYGLVACTASCLPYVAGYIASTGATFRRSVLITLIFNAGRITAYTLIGALLGIFSGLTRFFVDDTMLASLQIYSAIAFSIVTIIIGISLLYKNRKTSCTCNQPPLNPKWLTNRFDIGAYILGLSRGLVLCPPLIMLLLSSVLFASPVDSIAFAVLFGIGTAISPMLLIGGVTGLLLSKAPLLRNFIAIAGAIIIIMLGVISIVSSLMTLV